MNTPSSSPSTTVSPVSVRPDPLYYVSPPSKAKVPPSPIVPILEEEVTKVAVAALDGIKRN